MDKLKLKQFLIDSEQALIDEAKMDLVEYRKENALDHDNVLDLDDLSHSEASASFEQDLNKRIFNHNENLQHIKDISFAPSDEVRPGALVKVNGHYFIIAIPQKTFEFEGVKVEGISVEAPIFKLMAGKKVGETYSFHDVTYTIQDIK